MLRLFLTLALCIALTATFATRSIIPRKLRSLSHSESLLYSSPFGRTSGDSSRQSASSDHQLHHHLPSSLKTYVEWHAKHRQCYEPDNSNSNSNSINSNNSSSYSNSHSHIVELPHCNPPVPVLVWKCPHQNRTCAGLGDRVRGIQVTLLIAIAARRLFFIAMPDDPFPFAEVISPHSVNWTIPSGLNVPDLPADDINSNNNRSSANNTGTNITTTTSTTISTADELKMTPNLTWQYLDWFFCRRQRVGKARKRRKCRHGRKLPHDQALPHVSLAHADIDAYEDDIPQRLHPFPFLSVSCRLPGIVIMHLLRNAPFASRVPDLQERHISTSQLLQLLIRLLFQPARQVEQIITQTLPASFWNNTGDDDDADNDDDGDSVDSSAGYIAIHARTGQDVGEKDDRRFRYFNSHFNETVLQLLQCALRIDQGTQRNRIFLATDSILFKSTFAHLAQNLPPILPSSASLSAVSTARTEAATSTGTITSVDTATTTLRSVDVRYIDQRAYHFGIRTAKGIWKNRFDNMSEQYVAFLNVFADLYMLGSAHTIITTGSGFARTAYWLGDAQRLLIVEPGNGTEHCTM